MTAHEAISRMLFEFSYWHAMQNEPFKPRAFQLASESIGALGPEVEVAWKRGGPKALKELPGIGPAIAGLIDEFFRTGRVKEYMTLKKRFPVDIWGLAQIEGMGPKHIFELYRRLKIKDMGGLEHALHVHAIAKLPGFGEKSEEKIAKGLALLKRSSGRHLLGEIIPLADTIVARLSSVPGVKRCTYAGSLRRRQETVGDIDLIATTSTPETVMDAFTTMPEVEAILDRGKTGSSVRLTLGIDADLRVVPDKVYGATLQYFTGDRRHNVLLREFALSKGYKLNEYGLYKGKTLVTCKSEEDIYKKLGMDTPPPEIRVGHDELEAARKRTLPNLLPYRSIRGDLQTQTSWTDGADTVEAMAKAAKQHGLSYLAITDHTKSLAFIGGLNEVALKKQAREIDALNTKQDRSLARILKGVEVDIHADGALDLRDEALLGLDWVGVSIHSQFHQDEALMTKRVVKALSHPAVDCFFHPTARLIGKREPIALDFAEVLAAAKKYRVALEIDAFPERSDLKDLHVRMAVEARVPLVIDTDAHATKHFAFLPLGEAIARRGWATKTDVINTKTLPQFRTWLEKKRPRKHWTA
jgi:DNA polymerase (family 10)